MSVDNGRVYEVSPTVDTQFAPKGYVKLVAQRVYRAYAAVRQKTAPNDLSKNTISIAWNGLDSSFGSTTIQIASSSVPSVASATSALCGEEDGWVIIGLDIKVASNNTAIWGRPVITFTGLASSTVQVQYVTIQDVTDSTAAANAASAAATSASNASTSATAAGTSATSANTSATNAATQASNAATSAGAASTSAGNASTSASNASTSATNAAGSATSASTSQTAAANSAFSANTTVLAGLPDRYDGTTTSQFFSNTTTGSSSAISNLASNQTASGFGAVYEQISGPSVTFDWATRGIVTTNASKVISVEAEFQKTANTGGLSAATNMAVGVRSLDSAYASLGFTLSATTALTGSVQTISQQFSQSSASGILAWTANAIYLRPFARFTTEGSITSVTVQFRRLTITDVTQAVSAANSASAAATSASTATTQATAAGTSATSANTSATNAATSATNAASSAGAASTSAGAASTSASNASTSASNALGSANSASTSQTASANSATNANLTRASLFPDRYDGSTGQYFTTSQTGAPSAVTDLASNTSASGYGPVYQYSVAPSSTVSFQTRGVLAAVAGRIYQFEGEAQVISGTPSGLGFGLTLVGLDASYASVGSPTTSYTTFSGVNAVQVFSNKYSNSAGTGITAWPASSIWLRPWMTATTDGSSVSLIVQFRRLTITDVTQAVAASNSAAAAATSASNASTSATAAGTSATAANTSATNAATSASNASTSAGAASTSAGAASTSATNAAGSATSATNSQTAAANSAFAANSTVLVGLPDRYDGTTTSQFFSSSTVGSPAAISNLASNQTSGTYGSVYEAVISANTTFDWATRGVVVPTASKIINVEVEFQKTANVGSLTAATNMVVGVRTLDSSYASLGTTLSSSVSFTGAVQTISQQFAATSASGILAWAASAVYIRPFARVTTEVGITSATVQFRRLTISDVTQSVSAANSASAAATSASTASTQATAAGTSATSANTSATNAATSASNAATSAGAASTSAGSASTSASNASTSASNALGSANNASTSQTAAANSAFSANTTVLTILPERYDGNTTSQFFSNTSIGSVTSISNLASNQTASGYGSVYEQVSGPSVTFDWATRGVVNQTTTKIINVEVELQKTTSVGSLTAATNFAVGVRSLDASYASLGTTLSSTVAFTGSIQTLSQQFALNASTGILAWAAGSVYIRPFARFVTESGITSATVQFRRMTISDVTQSVAASNSASAAATSASNASTSATAAGTSATSANTSATNAATSSGTASTQAGLAATSASNAATSAGTASTQASNASTSATNAAGSATSASTSQTAAANSAFAANTTVLVGLPERYDGTTTSQFFSNTTTGSPSAISNLASNQTAGSYGAVYETIATSSQTFDWATRGVVAANGTKIINVELEFQRTAQTGTTGATMVVGVRSLDSSYASLGTTLSGTLAVNGAVQTISQQFAANAASGILAWAASTVFIRPFGRLVTDANPTSVTVQFRRLTISDVTQSVAASNSASAASTSASTASTQATNAGNSANSAQTSATNAATSASGASTSAGAASTSAGQASTSATNAAGSATSASTSQTAAATSATNAGTSATNANLSRALLFPDRFDGTTGQYFTNSINGSPSSVTDLASNASASGYGPVYQYSVAPNTFLLMATRGVLPAIAGKVYQLEIEAQVTAGTASGAGFGTYLLGLDSSYNSVGASTFGYQSFSGPHAVQILTSKFSDTASTGIYAWPASSVWLRPVMNVGTDASSSGLVVQFRRLTVTDVTQATAASNSAAAAATSASNASTSATAAGTSATAANTSATNAATSASNASTSAGAASTSAGTASTQATNASNSATTAAGSATSATNSQTAAANSAFAANTTVLAAFPERYDGTTTSQFFSNTSVGSPTAISNLTSNQTVAGYGSVYEQVSGPSITFDWATRGIITNTSTKIISVEAEVQKTANVGSLTSATNFSVGVRSLDSSYASLGTTLSATTAFNGSVQTVVQQFALNAASGILAWVAGSVYIRPFVRFVTEAGITSATVQFRRLTISDVTQSISAANSASAAATSASNASTSATAAGTSATSANTSATNASTSASNAATSATAASTSAGTASTQATNASNSATNAAGSATSAGSSQTAAATSATNAGTSAANANLSRAALFPDRYDGTSGQYFTNTVSGNPSLIADLASNASASGYGPVYQYSVSNGQFNSILTRAVLPAIVGKVYQLEGEAQVTSGTGTGSGFGISIISLDSSYNSIGQASTVYTTFSGVGAIQIFSAKFSDTAATGIGAWPVSSVWLRPVMTAGSASSFTIQFRRLTVTDVTQSTAASNSAASAATSASNASTSATAAGTSATSANTSATNASTSASNAATSASAASTSAGTASTQATNASNSATTAAGSATSATNSQTAAANSAFAANIAVLSALPDRYDGTTTSQFFSNTTLGSPSAISNLSSNQTVAGYGSVYEAVIGASTTFDWSTRGVVIPNATKIIKAELEFQKTANTGSITAATGIYVGVRTLDSSYASLGTTLSTSTAVTGSVQTISQMFAASAGTNILAWTGGAVFIRPFGRLVSEAGITSITVQFRRLTISDVTDTVNAANSAAAAATSASTASTQATAAGTSATAANTSATNASTSAGNAATSASAASTSAGTANTAATNASTSATNAAGSATTASTSQTAAATSATNANLSRVALFPDRYDGTTGQYFTGAVTGSPTSVSDVPSNATASGYGPVYQVSVAPSSTQSLATRGVFPAITGRIYQVEGEAQVISGTPSGSGFQITAMGLDASYASVQASIATNYTAFLGNNSVQVFSTKFSNSASSGIFGWSGSTIWVRPILQATTDASSVNLIVQFRRITVSDITQSTAASNSAAAAATSASNASTSATAAGTSATSANTSATNASTSASNAATSAGAASTSAGTASTQATNASNSATTAAGSATSASNSQTAAATSATNANISRAALFPDRYDGTTGQYFTASQTGSPTAVTDLASNASASGYGPVYQYSNTNGQFNAIQTRAVLPAISGKIYQLEGEAQVTSGTASGSGFGLTMIGLDANYNSVGSASTFYTSFSGGNAIQIFSTKYSDTSATGIYAWPASSIWVRPYMVVAASGSFVTQFRRLTVTDVTQSVAASNSAAAAATSASNASTSATAAGTSATAANTSATNAATSAGNASTSAGAASTSAGNASTQATNASNSATTAAGSATSATNSQTAAANSANSANLSVLVALPDRYDGTTTSQFFSNTSVGSPTTISNLASNQTAAAYGSVYEVVLGTSATFDWSIRGVVTTNATKIINVEVEFQKTASSGSLTSATNMVVGLRSLDSSYSSLGTTLSATTPLSGAVQIISQQFSLNSGTGILAWISGAIFVRPFARLTTESGITSVTVQFRRITTYDVTQSVAAANSASAAATSASNASTSATAAGTSATSANTSATNASTSASNAATSASAASTSAGTASTQATNASNSATTAAGSATSATNSQTAAANSAFAANVTVLASLPDRYDGTTTSQFFSNTSVGSPTAISNLASNQTASGYGSVYEVLIPTSSTIDWATRGIVVPNATKIIKAELEFQRTASNGSVTAATGVYVGIRAMDSSYASLGTTLSTTNATTGAVQSISQMFAASAATNILAWTSGAIFLRPFGRVVAESGITSVTVQFRRLTITDVTDAVNAANSAAAAATSASTASTQATAAGTSATAANTSATNAATSSGTATTQAGNAATSATNAATSAGTASTQASNASTSATNAAGSATSASTSQTAAANSATNANLSRASLFPDRYDSVGGQIFTQSLTGSPTSVTDVASNVTASGYGPVYQVSSAPNNSYYLQHRGVLPAVSGKVYQIEGETQIISGTPSGQGLQVVLVAMDSSYSAIGYPESSYTTFGAVNAIQVFSGKFSNSASSGIVAWTAGSVWLRPYAQFRTDGSSVNLVVQFRRITVTDVTQSVAASNSAAAAATSASNASTSATAAGTSATSANTSATNASTSASNAATSASAASTSAGTASTQASNASTSASNAAGSATSAGTSQTAAATSATNANISRAALFPDRYDGTTGQYFAQSGTGSPSAIADLPSNATASGYGPVYQATIAANGNLSMATRGVLPAVSGKIYQISADAQLISGPTTGSYVTVMTCLDSSYNYITYVTGTFLNFTSVGAIQTITSTFSSASGTGINSVWNASSVWLRPYIQANAAADGGIVVQFRRLTITDVTVSTAASNSASAAATSASNASTSATAAGTSATSANTSSTNAATSASNAATSASAASTSAGTASTQATNASNSATTAAGSATSAGTSQTAAATSATNANLSRAALFPDRYDGSSGQYFSTGYTGSPASLTDLASNATASGYGPVYQFTVATSQSLNVCTRAVLPAIAGKIYQVTAEMQHISGSTSGTYSIFMISLDSSYNTTGFPSASFSIGASGSIQTMTKTVSNTAGTGVDLLWAAGSAWVRPLIQSGAGSDTSATFQFRRLTVTDVTVSTAASNSASAAATSASNASTSSTNAGNSATSANTSATNASTSASAASGSASNALTYSSNASTSASQASTSASNAAGSASSAATSALVTATAATAAINQNPVFADWPTGNAFPNGWLLSTGANPNKVSGLFGSGNAIQMSAATNADGYFQSGFISNCVRQGMYVIVEVDLALNSGTFQSAGLLFRTLDSSVVTVHDYPMYFYNQVSGNTIVGNGTIGFVYRFRMTCYVSEPNAVNSIIYVMPHWSGFTGSSNFPANQITFYRVSVRPASSAEVDGFVGNASVKQVAAATADIAGRSSAYWSVEANSNSTTSAFISARSDTNYPSATPVTLKSLTNNMTFGTTYATKVAGSNGGWDSGVYSVESYTSSAYISFSPASTGAFMMGLNTDPLTDDSFTSIDGAWYFTGSGWQIYESSAYMGVTIATWSYSDVASIEYLSGFVNYRLNGRLYRSVAVSTSLTYYLDSSFATTGASVKNIVFAASGPSNNSDVSIGANEFHVYNNVGGAYKKTLSVNGGNVTISGNLTVSSGIYLGSGSAWQIQYASRDFTAADGDTISYGIDFGNIPKFSFAGDNLAALGSGEVYSLYADNATKTGFTARLKIVTPSTTSTTTTLTTSTTPGTGPTIQISIGGNTEATNHVYNYRVQGTITATAVRDGAGGYL